MPLSSGRCFLSRMPEDFVVTPWDVKGSIDYDRLITQFGTERITPELLGRLRRLAGDLHSMLRRVVFYSHRVLNGLLEWLAEFDQFALCTGLGPWSGIHICHILLCVFAIWLQDCLNAMLYFHTT